MKTSIKILGVLQIIGVLAIFSTLVLTFNTCKKEHISKISNNYGLLAVRKISTEVVKEGGMLTFKNKKAFHKVINILEQAKDNWNDQEDQEETDSLLTEAFTWDPELRAFEKQYNFHSLRRAIEEEEIILINNASFTFENDPDNHFIADPYIRTFLNTNLEFKVGDAVYKYLNRYFLAVIPDGDLGKLSKLRQIKDYDPYVDGNKLPSGIKIFAIRDYNAAGESGTSKSSMSPCPTCCKPDFTYNISAPLTVDFTDQSTSQGVIVSWEWDFGDGNTSVAQNPSHTYSSQATYNVKLTITDNWGCIKTYENSIDVGVTCDAAFKWEASADPTHIAFTDKSTTKASGGISSWHWDFGDGSTSSSSFPSHTYSSVGCYNVTLTVEDWEGCVDTETKSVTIDGSKVNCCRKIDTEKYKWDNFNNSNIRFKSKAWATSIVNLYHRVGAKTKSYKRYCFLSLCAWFPKKVDQITASIEGDVWKTAPVSGCNGNISCGDLNQIPIGYDIEFGESKAKYVYTVGDVFWTRERSLTATHSVTHNGESRTRYLRLHNRNCP